MSTSIDKSCVGNIGLFEVALKLSRMGKRITPHGGSCAFDLTDGEGNRYEVKTARASMKGDKEHYRYRGWVFASGNKNKNISKFEYTAYVLLDEEGEVERILLVPHDKDRFKNGRTAIMKDTKYQRETSPRVDLISAKWYDEYVI